MACTINMGISIDSHLIHACTTEPSGQELLRSHECTPSSPEALLDTLKLMVEKKPVSLWGTRRINVEFL
ncbi:hypothetical protein QW180_01100 [Vibrio sinaloensis]|nr:hypothetical protein [Vibrio sinaloensis]